MTPEDINGLPLLSIDGAYVRQDIYVREHRRVEQLERRLTEAKKLAREWEYDCRVERARAEQLETALRWYDDHKRPDGSYDGEMWGDLRAALDGGTATPETK